MAAKPISVLFVCLGNICRSPTAHGVFETLVARRGWQSAIVTDSAGTAAWHSGKQPDSRSMAVALGRGYDLSGLRARQVTEGDFRAFDYILAMDHDNLAHLLAMQPDDFRGHLGLFLDFHPQLQGQAVPDPYYGGQQGFDRVLDMVETASEHLLDHIRSTVSNSR